MSDTKIKSSNIGNLAVTHDKLHTTMDLTAKTVTIATPTANTHPATKLYVDTEVANLIDSAPGTLDTLNELAAAVNDDANFNATIASSIATKLPLAGGTMTGNLQIYKAEPIITLQRSNNALLSGLSWQGSGGAEAASIKLDGTSGATNTLIMSTYNGSTMAERLRLMTNAAGGIAVTGTISVTGTVDGVDIAARDAILTSTTTTAGAALPKAGGTMTGNLLVSGAKLGVGTTAPLSQLQVGGSTTVSADSKIILGKSTAASQSHLPVIQHSSTSGLSNDLVLAATSGDGAIRFYTGASSASGTFGGSLSAERLRIDKDGNVGIGTTSPDANLVIEYAGDDPTGATSRVGAFSIKGGHTTLDMGVNDDSNYNSWIQTRHKNLATYPTAYYNLAINPLGGNVGIGNTDPNLPLTVTSNSGANAIAIRARSADDYGFIQFYNNAGTALRGQIYNHNGAMAISTSTTGTARLHIDTSGNVGIGTTTPDALLHVQHTAVNSPFIVANRYNDTSTGSEFRSIFAVSEADPYGTGTTATLIGNHNRHIHIGPFFDANGAASAVDSLTILSTGNVGIGTSSPGTDFHVNGKAVFGATGAFYGHGGVHILDDQYSKWSPTLSYYSAALRLETHWKGSDNHDRAAGDYGGGIAFNHLGGHSALHANNMHAYIGLRVEDTPGHERSNLVFATNNEYGSGLHDGGITERMCITPTGNMILTNPAGIKIHTAGTTNSYQANVDLHYNGTAGGDTGGIRWFDKRNVQNAGVQNSLQNDGVGTAAADLHFKTSTGGTLSTAMQIHAEGYVTKPLNPSFHSYGTGMSSQSSPGVHGTWNQIHDKGNNFTPGTNATFTAPVAGVYAFYAHANFNNNSHTPMYWRFQVNGNMNGIFYSDVTSDTWVHLMAFQTIDLSVNDYVRLVYQGDPDEGADWAHFGGYLIG